MKPHKHSQMANKQPRGEDGGLMGGFGVKWAKGEGVFIGLESNERPAKVAYVWVLFTEYGVLSISVCQVISLHMSAKK
jgi:hypothetical protein